MSGRVPLIKIVKMSEVSYSKIYLLELYINCPNSIRMPQIAYLGLENFRSFEEQTIVEFAPITIITGKNSSGKSNLINAIRTFKSYLNIETEKSKFTPVDVWKKIEHLYADLIDARLGNFSNLINRNSEQKEISFQLQSSFQGFIGSVIIKLILRPQQHNPQHGELASISFRSANTQHEVYSVNKNLDGTYTVIIDYPYFVKAYEDEMARLQDILKIQLKYAEKLSEKDELESDDFKNFQDELYMAHPSYMRSREISFISSTEAVNRYLTRNYKPYLDIIGSSSDLEEFCKYRPNNFLTSFSEESLTEVYQYLNNGLAEKISFEEFSKILIQQERSTLQKIELKIRTKDIWEKIEDLITSPLEVFARKDENIISTNISDEDLETNIIEWLSVDDMLKISNCSPFFKKFISENLAGALLHAASQFKEVAFVGSFRNTVERFYSNKADASYFGLLVNKLTKLNGDKQQEVYSFLRRYLKKFEIGDELIIEPGEEGNTNRIYIINGSEKILLADLGYGVSQVIPLMLEIVLHISENFSWGVDDFIDLRGNSTIIIEEPEANLHPAFQSLLADMFSEAAIKYRIQFIIETHSEYFIRKLQYLIAKGTIDQNLVSLYYFYDPRNLPEGEAQVKKINIRKDGMLEDDFGEGFYDEATRLTFELLKIQHLN